MKIKVKIKQYILNKHIEKRDKALLAAKKWLLDGHEVKYSKNMSKAAFHIARITKLSISIEKDLLQ